MAYDSATFQRDLNLLKTYLPDSTESRDDVLDQLKELARQIRVVQMRLAEMADDRQPARSPLGKATSENRVVLLRKALLGPNGGQAILYDKNLASRLIAKGVISGGEHKIWKVSGLLPERVNLRDAKPEPFLMARPA
jgi:hypothetical protein